MGYRLPGTALVLSRKPSCGKRDSEEERGKSEREKERMRDSDNVLTQLRRDD